MDTQFNKGLDYLLQSKADTSKAMKRCETLSKAILETENKRAEIQRATISRDDTMQLLMSRIFMEKELKLQIENKLDLIKDVTGHITPPKERYAFGLSTVKIIFIKIVLMVVIRNFYIGAYIHL